MSPVSHIDLSDNKKRNVYNKVPLCATDVKIIMAGKLAAGRNSAAVVKYYFGGKIARRQEAMPGAKKRLLKLQPRTSAY